MSVVGMDASNLRRGGGVTHLVGLLGSAEPLEHGFHRVIVWGNRQTLSQLPKRPWLETVAVPALERMLPFRLAWQRWTLPRLARQQCDLLFSPGGICGSGFRPVVTMSRNMLPFEPAERMRYGLSLQLLRNHLLRIGQSRSFRRADGMIFLTDYARRVVIDATGPLKGQVTTIPHGTDDRFRNTPALQHELNHYTNQRPLRLLYVSIIDHYKHQWNVVEAVGQLRQQGLPVALDLVGPGEGPLLQRLQETISEVDPGGEFIRYHGGLPHDKLPACYHSADAFVFASSCENMPNILLEAMSAGLPIASAASGPMPEMLQDYGVYFDPTDAEDIAAALNRLLSDRNFRAVAAAGASRLSAEYSWERCATETFEFLDQVLSEHRQRHAPVKPPAVWDETAGKSAA